MLYLRYKDNLKMDNGNVLFIIPNLMQQKQIYKSLMIKTYAQCTCHV